MTKTFQAMMHKLIIEEGRYVVAISRDQMDSLPPPLKNRVLDLTEIK